MSARGASVGAACSVVQDHAGGAQQGGAVQLRRHDLDLSGGGEGSLSDEVCDVALVVLSQNPGQNHQRRVHRVEDVHDRDAESRPRCERQRERQIGDFKE